MLNRFKSFSTNNLSTYLIIFFTSLVVLSLETILTRVFSLIFFYHLSFMAVSLALLGLGSGALMVNLTGANRIKTISLKPIVCVFPWSIFLLLIVFYLGSSFNIDTYFFFILSFFFCLIPFFLAGFIITHIFKEAKQEASKLYFFDLAGAALATFLIMAALKLLGGSSGLIFIALVASVPYMLLNKTGGLRKYFLPLILFCLLTINYLSSFIVITPQKIGTGDRPFFSRWNTFSVVGVYPSTRPDLHAIKIDAAAETDLLRGDYVIKNKDEVLSQVQTLVYSLKDNADILIIGPGGGRDVSAALLFNPKHITGVEINPIIVNNIMKDKYREFSGNLYNNSKVTIATAEGRSYIRRNTEQYDIIQATLVDTWAATSAGAFTLTENNLYTKEAFQEYYQHLNDDGILSFTRWYVASDPAEMLRLTSLGLAALGDENQEARNQIIILSDNFGRASFLLKKSSFTEQEIQKMREVAAERDYTILYGPGGRENNVFSAYITADNWQEFQDSYQFNISAPSDDQPFFFYTLKPQNFFRASILRSEKNNLSLTILTILLILISLVILVFIFLPLSLSSKPVKINYLLWFFALIGIGYIFTEIVFMQKFILFLGHPTYSLTVVLAGLLIATGVGSLTTNKWRDNIERKLVETVVVVQIIFLVYYFILPRIFAGLIASPVAWRIVISFLLIIIPGFFLGRFFPLGLRLIGALDKNYIAWAFSINSACSVFGSVAAIILAINFGYNFTLFSAALLYFLIIPLILIRHRSFPDDRL